MLMDDPRGPATGELGHRHRIELCRRLLAEGPSALFPADLEAEYLRFHVQRTFELPSFAAAIAFVNRVAELAEGEDHHPDMTISYKRVTLRWTTHSAGGITDRDRELAARSADLS